MPNNRAVLAAIALAAAVALSAPLSGGRSAESAGLSTDRVAGYPQPANAVYVVSATGNVARYRVREQLVGLDLPNDAVGETREVSGAIVLGADGRLVPGSSRIVVGVGALTSDRDRRDQFIRRNTLETEQFPTVEFIPTGVRGIQLPPAPGTRTFQLLGNLTIRGVTRPTSWNVNASVAGDTVSGSASTRFTFADFDLTQPRVRIVLSVADSIGLEYDFRLIRQPAATSREFDVRPTPSREWATAQNRD